MSNEPQIVSIEVNRSRIWVELVSLLAAIIFIGFVFTIAISSNSGTHLSSTIFIGSIGFILLGTGIYFTRSLLPIAFSKDKGLFANNEGFSCSVPLAKIAFTKWTDTNKFVLKQRLQTRRYGSYLTPAFEIHLKTKKKPFILDFLYLNPDHEAVRVTFNSENSQDKSTKLLEHLHKLSNEQVSIENCFNETISDYDLLLDIFRIDMGSKKHFSKQ